MFFFGKKKAKNEEKENIDFSQVGKNETAAKNEPQDWYTISIIEKFKLEDSTDIVAVGRVKGTVKKGDAAYIINFGEDSTPVTMTDIIALEKFNEMGEFVEVDEVTDTNVAVRLNAKAGELIQAGSVIHSRKATIGSLHDAYINAIGDAYIKNKELDLTEEEIDNLSMTDLIECWRLYGWLLSRSKELQEEDKNKATGRIAKIAAGIIRKLLKADHIYAVYNKKTNEPHLFAQVMKRGDSYQCSPPEIMLITEAYYNVYSKKFADGEFELRKIENGKDKIGIFDFLGTAFYINGAQGVQFLYGEVSIASEMIIKKPDMTSKGPAEIPITNPDVLRWMLLIGQMGQPKDDKTKLMFNMYYKFLSDALVKAKFVVPMKVEDKEALEKVKGANGAMTFAEDTKIGVPTQEGRNGRKALRVYTDWRNLRSMYGAEYGGMIQSIDDIIETYDVAINVTKYPLAGCYVSKSSYEKMKG